MAWKGFINNWDVSWKGSNGWRGKGTATGGRELASVEGTTEWQAGAGHTKTLALWKLLGLLL